ncbi:MAG TPA: DNA repair protein RecN [Coxiellaceae bacterium]|nr:MAG: DNA repair protein RecN [Gammaproteobacteria bacterium RIFCSPHIGHO2_12_FULL_36_30]HLB56994.1 DNA repair protein RecN [Coxiellaceae bacterium]
MLNHIHIKNFIIVKSLSLDFQNGLHVLTGETGAGKSIWIDAIEIGLGGRADSNMIYPGEKTCDITLCFDLNNLTDAKKWLAANDLPNDNECIIRRIIDQDKPSRTTINGIPIPQQLVRTFSEYVLSIHGQHQHQRLLKSDDQRELLDRYANNSDLLLKIQTYYDEWKSIDREVQILKKQIQNKTSDLNLWQYQLEELENCAIQENEYEKLFTQFQQLHHAKQFSTTLHEALLLLENENSPAANNLTHQSLQHLNTIRTDDSKIENIRSLLQTATIHLDEARDALQQYCNTIDFSGEQLEKIEKRLSLLQDIARKHHIDPTQLTDIENSLRQKILLLEKSDETITDLEMQQNKILKNYQENAKQLTLKRQKAAKKLCVAITDQMQQLGMNGGKFDIQLQTNESPISNIGSEKIHFLIATNPGQTPHDLSQIVSGGELSRLSLIIQVLTAEQKNTPTLIFDEVDSGVGGKTADLVGKLLRQLSNNAQVLCVTHLPQVAANGHHHFFAEKITDGKSTTTAIRLLNNKDRTKELARMLSGSKITEKSLQHANELLETIG